MELTDEHIAFIRQDIREKGITMSDLADSLVDHICCTLENNPGADFHKTYSQALAAFGNGGLLNIQQETILLLIFKKEITMKKTMYVLGFIAAFLISTGLLFKMMHWPGGAPILIIAILTLNFGFLPMYFYDRYKSAVS